jgi:hypothetical protein
MRSLGLSIVNGQFRTAEMQHQWTRLDSIEFGGFVLSSVLTGRLF